MTKSAHWCSWSCDLHGNLEGVLSHENTPEGLTETHKSSSFPYKQTSGKNGYQEWLRMTNAFILCDLIWKVMQWTEKVALKYVRWPSFFYLLKVLLAFIDKLCQIVVGTMCRNKLYLEAPPGPLPPAPPPCDACTCSVTQVPLLYIINNMETHLE